MHTECRASFLAYAAHTCMQCTQRRRPGVAEPEWRKDWVAAQCFTGMLGVGAMCRVCIWAGVDIVASSRRSQAASGHEPQANKARFRTQTNQRASFGLPPVALSAQPCGLQPGSEWLSMKQSVQRDTANQMLKVGQTARSSAALAVEPPQQVLHLNVGDRQS